MRVTQPLSRIKPSVFKLVVLCLFTVAGLLAGGVLLQSGKATAAGSLAACTPTGTTYGTLSFSPSNSPANPINMQGATSATTYNMWVRMEVPSVSSSSPLLLNVNNATGSNCYAVPGSAFTTAYTANTPAWTWVNAASGLTLPTLNPTNNSLLITGTQSGANLDLVEFLNSGCVPTDNSTTPSLDGANCTENTATAPTVSVTAPTTGSTVSGTVSLTATAAGTSGASIAKVQFQVDGQNVGTADTTAPYTTSWSTTGLTNGSTHTITAIATDNNSPALSTTSSSVTVTVNNAPTCATGTLAAPTGLAQNQSTTTYTAIGMTWTAVTPTPGCSIKGYNVYRDGSTTALNGSTLISGTSYTNTGLTASASHTYTVQAVDTDNTSAKSGGVTMNTTADNQAPNAPGGPSATAVGAGQINLGWSASTDNPNPGGVGVQGYNVYRCSGASCTPSVTGTPINGATPVTGTSYSDSTVSAGTSYGYVVTAVDNASNESSGSTIVRATTSTPPPTCSGNPSQPGTPTAGTRTLTGVAFSWAASTATTGCTLGGYHIYQVNGATYTLVTATITGTSTLTATITGLAPNTIYTYAVQAYDTSGHTSDRTTTGSQGVQIGIATLPDTTAPTAPASLTATAASSAQVNLNWPTGSDNIGVTGYKIYRCTGAGCSSFTLLTTITGTTTLSYNDTAVSPSTSYTYQVSAIDGAGNESTKTSSNSVTTPAAAGTAPTSAPTSVSTQVQGAYADILGWNAPSGGGTITGYHVYIDGVLDTYTNGKGLSDTFASTGGTLNCLAPSVNYTITVKAFNSAGEGPAATTTVSTPSQAQGGGWIGDFDCSGSVGSSDLNTLAVDWNPTHTKQYQPFQGDSNGDVHVDSIDLNALAVNWGQPR